MKLFASVCSLFIICCLAISQVSVHGGGIPQYLYTNDNLDPSGNNSTTAYSVSGTTLKEIDGSPFNTGGQGSGVNPVLGIQSVAEATLTTGGYCLFVSDANSSDVAAFQVNMQTGALTAAPGSPYFTQSQGKGKGIGLTVPHTADYVVAATYGGSSITVFSLASDCSLQFKQIYSTPAQPIGIKFTPSGSFLVVSYYGSMADTFSVQDDESLVENGPFHTKGEVRGVDGFCESQFAIFADHSNSTQIEAYAIGDNGNLTAEPGSPFTFKSGKNSEVLAVDYGRNDIFISNQVSSSQTVLSYDKNRGKLSLVPGSPFSNPASGQPAGMAFTFAGNAMFVADTSSSPHITVYSINSDGSLSRTGQPVSTGKKAGLSSLRTVPDPVCKNG